MCAKRSGVVKRLKARRAELLKLLNSGSKLNWNDSVKLHAQLENIKTLISERKNQIITVQNKIDNLIENNNKQLTINSKLFHKVKYLTKNLKM